MSFPTIADMVHLDIDRLVENERKKELFERLIEYDVAQDILGRPLDESLERVLAQFSVSDLDTLFSTTSFLNEAPCLLFEEPAQDNRSLVKDLPSTNSAVGLQSLSNEMPSAAAISIADTESCSTSEWIKPDVSSTNAFTLRPVTPGDWAYESEEPTSPPLVNPEISLPNTFRVHPAPTFPRKKKSTSLPKGSGRRKSRKIPKSKVPDNKKKSKTVEVKCPYSSCKVTTTRKTDMERHVRTQHTGERIYECPWSGCYKMFPRSDSCKTHFKSHLFDENSRLSWTFV